MLMPTMIPARASPTRVLVDKQLSSAWNPWSFLQPDDAIQMAQASSHSLQIMTASLPVYDLAAGELKEVLSSSNALATWRGDSLDMDTIIHHFNQFGSFEVEDWASEGGDNELYLVFSNREQCTRAVHASPHRVKDCAGKLYQIVLCDRCIDA